MIDLNKFTSDELNDIKNIFLKNSQRSVLDSYPLFTDKTVEKAMVFSISYRMLININNAMINSSGKEELQKELKINEDNYYNVLHLLEHLRKNVNYGKSIIRSRLSDLLNTKEIDDLIDLTSVLTEKTVLISVSKLKGVILTGTSEKEFKRVMTGES